MKKENSTIRNADDYIVNQPPEFRKLLETLRSLIKKTVPKAEEVISYGVICYKYHYMLVGIGVTKNTCSFYTMSPSLVKEMKEELSLVKKSGATLHLENNKSLPTALIKKIIKLRMGENELLAAARKMKK